MKEQKDEKWLDELISGAIDSSRPQFDAEQWKEKYPEEFKMLASRTGQSSQPSTIHPNVWRLIWKSPITRIAAAAVIIAAIGFFAVHKAPDEQTEKRGISQVTRSPVEMMTVASLNIAYRRGGMDAVEEQCDKVCEMLGTQPADISLEELMAGFNGS
jgi:hypothetical protein